MGVGQDPAGLVQSLEQAVPVAPRPPGQPLLPGQLARPLGQAVGAEQLPADRPPEQLVECGTVSGARGGKQKTGYGDSQGCGSAAGGEMKVKREGRRASSLPSAYWPAGPYPVHL